MDILTFEQFNELQNTLTLFEENQDLKDIRFFKGSLLQWNEYMLKRIKELDGEPNPYKEMKYLYPIKRTEHEEDAITYQDFINGQSKKSKYQLKNRKTSNY